jgi:protease IV
METKRKQNGCLWGVLALLFAGLLAVVLVVGGIAFVVHSGGHALRSAELGEDESPSLNEIWSCGSGDTKVVTVPLKGVILLDGEDGFFGSEAGSAGHALRSIRRATNDEDVQAIILEVDSGGGGITASDVLYRALEEFREGRKGRKVIAIFDDVAASGGYYVAAAADHIIAHPTAITGSIGVLMQSFNVRELSQKLGVKDVTIKSGANKDILNPFNELSQEQRDMLQGIVDQLHSRFVKIVADSRGLEEEKVRRFADGRIFTADTAVELGLVDEIGYWSDAVAKTAELLKVDNVKVYRYEEAFSFSSLLRAAARWNPASAMFPPASRSRLMYLWQL